MKPGLIETMRRGAEGTVKRLDGHMERLSGSARDLGIDCDLPAIRSAIADLPHTGEDARLRLELDPDGEWRLESHGFSRDAPLRVWRLRIAETRLHSADTLLRHKTTRRYAYEEARREWTAAMADEVLLLNERNEVCEGTITSVFVRDGAVLLTPALACGLLQGVLRQELLDRGEAREAVLRLHDLQEADALFIGNSLRGLLQARLMVDDDPAG